MEIHDDILSEFGDAKATESGNRLPYGRYKLDIVELEYKKLYQGYGFVLHFRVAESEGNAYGQTPAPVGTVGSEVYKTAQEGALGRLKGVICKLIGKKPESVDRAASIELLKKCASAAQPLRGIRAGCDVIPYTIKKGEHKGKDMARLVFEGMAQTKDEIVARRKALDSAPAAPPPAPPKPAAPPPAPPKPADDDFPF